MIGLLFEIAIIIMPILLLSIALNVSNLRKEVTQIRKKIAAREYTDYLADGELMEYLGKKEQALEAYQTAMFFVKKKIAADPDDKSHFQNKMLIAKKIEELK